jgi:hypothetical protein
MVGATSPCSLKVVIIDAGSRAFRDPISKKDFNETVMPKFWKHVGGLLKEQPEELKEQRQRWSLSGWDMNQALQKYKECLQNLRYESNSTLQISRVHEDAEPLLDVVTLQQAPATGGFGPCAKQKASDRCSDESGCHAPGLGKFCGCYPDFETRWQRFSARAYISFGSLIL